MTNPTTTVTMIARCPVEGCDRDVTWQGSRVEAGHGTRYRISAACDQCNSSNDKEEAA